ncbi:MAG: hypothetical protein ACHP8B_07410 [Terriglobales bacterium]
MLFADGQETIPDYAKFEVDKIYLHWGTGVRVLMTAAGDSDSIDMLWSEVVGRLKASGNSETPAVKAVITQTVARVTKKCFLPWPKDSRPCVSAIWVIQQLEPGLDSISVFRTRGLAVVSIERNFFEGSPLLIARYLSDLYLKDTYFGVDEAEALAAFMLHEAKMYDPDCGQKSDIITLTLDGEIRWVFRQETDYWDEHFALYKKSQTLMPLLSCAGPKVQDLYRGHLQRFVETVKFLVDEQKKMRQCRGAFSASLEGRLVNSLAKSKAKHSLKEEIDAETNPPKEPQAKKKKAIKKEHSQRDAD